MNSLDAKRAHLYLDWKQSRSLVLSLAFKKLHNVCLFIDDIRCIDRMLHWFIPHSRLIDDIDVLIVCYTGLFPIGS